MVPTTNVVAPLFYAFLKAPIYCRLKSINYTH